MCQGKVYDAKQANLKEVMPEKYEMIKNKLTESVNHPNEDDIKSLTSKINKYLIYSHKPFRKQKYPFNIHLPLYTQ